MKLSFIGLGYVGLVSSICLASKNHRIRGYDNDNSKIELLESKKLYINEKDLQNLFEDNFSQFSFSNEIDEELYNSDLVFICVDTPYDKDNILNLSNLLNLVDEIASKKNNSKEITILIRSTIPPGTIDSFNKKYSDKNLIFISNPEFLREGNAVEDFFNGNLTVIGGENKKSIDTCLNLYNDFPSKKIVTDPKNAELIKFVNNSFHALKITFANEIGQICSSLDMDSNELMSIFKSDKQLNISDKYLSPGFAYGGSCLPKDTNGLKNLAKSSSISVPVISSISESNHDLIQNFADRINELSPMNVLIFGITFKKGTDDLRGSPIIELSKLLNLNQFDFIDDKIFDKKLSFNNISFVKVDNDFIVKDYDLIILNHANLNDQLLSKIYKCNSIIDLNHMLEKKSNVTTIT